MESNTSPIRGFFSALNRNQKIVLGLGVVALIAVIAFLPQLFQISQKSDDNETGTANSSKTENYTDEQGYTIVKETYTNDQGEEVIITGTKTDPYGNVTTLDPSLITTYFPYQVMRAHKNWESTFRFYLSISEKDKKIYADMEDCDVEQDKRMIQDYIDSIPIDLSDYYIEYSLTSTDADCRE